MKSESFFKGTLILISANAISKILGAVLKIPLTYILGEQGMAIYQTAFSASFFDNAAFSATAATNSVLFINVSS